MATIAFAKGGSLKHAAPDTARLFGAGENWPAVGGEADESNYSRLAQIDTSDIGKLGLAWSLDLPPRMALISWVSATSLSLNTIEPAPRHLSRYGSAVARGCFASILGSASGGQCTGDEGLMRGF